MKAAGPMPGDPAVRPDGLCATCLHPRRPEASRKYGGAAAEVDPFCSTVCCRIWHAVPRASADYTPPPVPPPLGCVGCAVPVDYLTPGCTPCVARHRARLVPREAT